MKSVITSFFVLLFLLTACKNENNHTDELLPVPKEIIDLGALITEDLPEKVWGGLMQQLNYTRSNQFEIVNWEFDTDIGKVTGSNSYFTIFNHGGPHVDAPNHVNLGKGIDGLPINSFIGPLKVIDVSNFPFGRSVPVEEIRKQDIQPGDIVIIYTRHKLPLNNESPRNIALTYEAAKYLADLPVRAFGTDAFNVEGTEDQAPVETDIAAERLAPIHFAFLSKGIPLFEQLFNVDKLLNKKNMFFIGAPLNIKDGDGMIVRPVVLVY